MNRPVRNDQEPIRWTYWITRLLVKHVILRSMTRLTYSGIENIPKTGGVIIASNHASVIDPPAVGAGVPREMCFFAKKELFENPLMGAVIRYYNAMPVDRHGFNAGSVKKMMNLLREGWAVLMFPEGTRTRTGKFLEPKSGVGMIATLADVPVVPCLIEGTYDFKPFRRHVHVHYLPPFRPSEVKASDKREHYLLVSERIMCDIIKLHEVRMAARKQAISS